MVEAEIIQGQGNWAKLKGDMNPSLDFDKQIEALIYDDSSYSRTEKNPKQTQT